MTIFPAKSKCFSQNLSYRFRYKKNYWFQPKRKLSMSVTIGISRNGKKPFGHTLRQSNSVFTYSFWIQNMGLPQSPLQGLANSSRYGPLFISKFSIKHMELSPKYFLSSLFSGYHKCFEPISCMKQVCSELLMYSSEKCLKKLCKLVHYII